MKRFSLPVFLSILFLLAIILLLIAWYSGQFFQGLFVNISASFIMSIVTVIIIDRYFLGRNNLKKGKIKESLANDLIRHLTLCTHSIRMTCNFPITDKEFQNFENMTQHKNLLWNMQIIPDFRLHIENNVIFNKDFFITISKQLGNINTTLNYLVNEYYKYGLLDDEIAGDILQLKKLSQMPGLFSVFPEVYKVEDFIIPESGKSATKFMGEILKKQLLDYLECLGILHKKVIVSKLIKD